jgi:hypothetical protein
MADDDPNRKAAFEYLKIKLHHGETLSGALSALIQTSIRVSFLLNGAAIVAVLSVYGAKGGTAFPNSALGAALLVWIFGLLATAAATGSYTWAQRQFQVESREDANNWAKKYFGLDLPSEGTSAGLSGYCLRIFAIVSWLLSVFLFCAGAIILVVFAFFV